MALDRREASFLTVAPNVAGVTSPDPTIAQVSFRKHMVVAQILASLQRGFRAAASIRTAIISPIPLRLGLGIHLKILHFADSHVGVELYGRPDPATGLNTRLIDFSRALDRIADAATGEKVDLVVFAGDAYRSREPNPTHQREFASRILRISQSGIPVYMLAGNHDMSTAAGRATSVDIFETLEVPNVTICREPAINTISTRSGPIQVVGVPWFSRHRILSREEGRKLDSKELDGRFVEAIMQFIASAVGELKPGLPAILVSHLTALGARYGSERSITVGDDPIVPVSGLALPRFSYVALGHIHRHQSLNDDPPVVYSGSIERVDFGEESEEKGYVLASIEDVGTTWEFRSLPARDFVTVEVEVKPASKRSKGIGQLTPTDQVLEAIRARDIGDAVVRVRLRLDAESERQIDYQAIRRSLSGCFYNAGVSRQLVGDDRIAVSAAGLEDLTPVEALDLYLRSRSTPRLHRQALLERARLLLGDAG